MWLKLKTITPERSGGMNSDVMKSDLKENTCHINLSCLTGVNVVFGRYPGLSGFG